MRPDPKTVSASALINVALSPKSQISNKSNKRSFQGDSSFDRDDVSEKAEGDDDEPNRMASSKHASS